MVSLALVIGRRARLSTPRPRGELAERPLLELAHALRAHPEAATDLTQALLWPVDAVAGAQDVALALGQPGQQAEQVLELDGVEHALVLALGHRVDEHVAER